MKFTLKDYQDDAVRDVLTNLRKGAKRWREDGDKHAFSLTATTGAGKTVMAAAVFEALFHGNDDVDFAPDPSAVVIWFSDDPSLNEQSRFRLLEASNKLTQSDLIVVPTSFNQERLQAGKIYFLNTQKLSRNSLLVRGHGGGTDESQPGTPPFEGLPEGHSHTIWDTIKNTVEDPDLTLYLVLDEAHRGLRTNGKTTQDEKPTIVSRLINGNGSTPPIPVVWGISATVERFNAAMAGAEGRGTLPNVVVDAAKVQESGLLKDTLVLDIPDEAGQFDTVLVRRGTDKLVELSAAWAAYATQQNDADTVEPLMVLQVPKTPDHNEIGKLLDTIFQRWPELPTESIAHVFGEHTLQTFGSYQVAHISPERVQESTWVRVLIAKDAISTGWDCPRAEVMVSFRTARDRTHITQLLGRMIRTPLARRIPGNERLNSVDCLLPFFDIKSVEAVADALMSGGGEAGDVPLPGRRVLINPIEVVANPSVPEDVWDKLLTLPAQSLPRRGVKPVKRLTALAQELATDGLLADAGKIAHAELHKVLDAAKARFIHEINTARKAVLTVEGKTLTSELSGTSKSFDDFVEEADYAVIDDAYKRASRTLGADVCRTYAEHLADANSEADSDEDALLEAHTDIGALGLVADVKTYLDEEADKLAKTWLDQYRVPIKALTDERQETYRQIKELSVDPQDIDLAKPSSRMEPTTVRAADGTETALPTLEHHLMCGPDGSFPFDLGGNTWEAEVLAKEMARPGFVAWYRNPSRASRESLGVVYDSGAGMKLARPDFLFFTRNADGTIGAAIVDPHGTQYGDALPKLRGLARYAADHADIYQRIEAVAKIGGTFRVLDLTDVAVRAAVFDAVDARTLYESPHAVDY
ncbi:DEAD/DEAH box helicase [Mycobacterium lehmannii]|uniref:DEAD/DEAH box helicase n=1 Tax=Mycobacterium lehmannii TaxID=2048550 RepID=UPI000B945605|nr:DEAD/DEAH box helicase family protein [Mycobacterium lehmannii]